MPKIKVCLIHHRANIGYGWVGVSSMEAIFETFEDREIINHPCDKCKENANVPEPL
jgi:hypothetical protein